MELLILLGVMALAILWAAGKAAGNAGNMDAECRAKSSDADAAEIAELSAKLAWLETVVREQAASLDWWAEECLRRVAEERKQWSERDDVHTESSRIYSRLAGAVRAGADDATLALLLRAEVTSRQGTNY